MRRLLPLLAALVAAALLLAGCGSSGDSAAPDVDATLVLDFTPNAVHSGIYTAVARGFDTAEGVRLHVQVPGSSTDSARLLLSGRATFAILDIHDLAIARERGEDLVGVMALVERPLAAVIAQSGVANPRALEGRKVGVTGAPSDTAVLDSIVRGAGGDPSRVDQVNIGYNAVPALLGGRVDGATAFWDVEGIALRQRRPGIREFRVDEYGAPSYPELILVTTRRQLDENPDVVKSTVRALVRGYGTAIDDPEGAISDLQDQVPGLDRRQLEAQMDVVVPAFQPPGGEIGQLVPSTLRRWAAWEARFGIVRSPPNVGQTFDTSIVEPSRNRSGD